MAKKKLDLKVTVTAPVFLRLLEVYQAADKWLADLEGPDEAADGDQLEQAVLKARRLLRRTKLSSGAVMFDDPSRTVNPRAGAYPRKKRSCATSPR